MNTQTKPLAQGLTISLPAGASESAAAPAGLFRGSEKQASMFGMGSDREWQRRHRAACVPVTFNPYVGD